LQGTVHGVDLKTAIGKELDMVLSQVAIGFRKKYLQHASTPPESG
jgi:hypothetical protein